MEAAATDSNVIICQVMALFLRISFTQPRPNWGVDVILVVGEDSNSARQTATTVTGCGGKVLNFRT